MYNQGKIRVKYKNIFDWDLGLSIKFIVHLCLFLTYIV